MFDELLRELKRLDGPHKISVSIPTDTDGYLDRECPSKECLFEFKVHEDDWSEKVRDEEVFCPFCGHTAQSDKWLTQQQVEHVEKAAYAHVQQRIGGAIKRDAENWNRRLRPNSFISMTMRVDSSPQQILLPPSAAEPMRLKISCPACSCRYAVIGAAFFCPACGHNAADLMLSQAMAGIRNAVDAIPNVRAAIPDKDAADTTVPSHHRKRTSECRHGVSTLCRGDLRPFSIIACAATQCVSEPQRG